MKYLATAIVSFLVSLSIYSSNLGPFESFEYVRFPFLTAKVTMEGNVYYLLGIDDVDGKEILGKCEAQMGKSDCEEGFLHDFAGTMTALGYTVGDEVKLNLYRRQGHLVFDKTVSLTTDVEIEVEVN